MLRTIFYSISLLFLSAISLKAQDLQTDYYQPYNFPNSYESDRLNRSFKLLLSAPPIGSGYYSLLGYGDIGKIKLTEYMNFNYGLGFAFGLSHDRTILYKLGKVKAYDQEENVFAKAMAGTGLTFRLFNPLNFSVRTGLIAGYEQYTISNVRPMKLDGDKEDIEIYKRSTSFNIPINYFTDFSVFIPFKKARLNVSYVSLQLLSRKVNILYAGFSFPVSN